MSTPAKASLPPDYFEQLYSADPDPWRFATSDYERDKYRHTLASLPQPHFRSAFEVGCSIGILTAQLAPRCDSLLAVDVSETALAQARIALSDIEAVSLARMQVPADWPDRRFDLILLSEVVYYLNHGDIARLAERTVAALEPHGCVLLVHWTEPTNYPCSGDEAVELFIAGVRPHLRPDLQERRLQYRLDRLIRH